MKIILNNRDEVIDRDELTVQELLDVKKFVFKMLVIKINGKLVKKPDYDTAKIKDGDNVTVLHLVSGG
ncbi:MAG: thiamine biosynthesis protein ThiS [Marinilabiliales bacterium]|nr:MAG: thiamine biosynthesis protein ThiS [Marinilabiliales bacterium]